MDFCSYYILRLESIRADRGQREILHFRLPSSLKRQLLQTMTKQFIPLFPMLDLRFPGFSKVVLVFTQDFYRQCSPSLVGRGNDLLRN